MNSQITESNELNFSSKHAWELQEECETFIMKIEREKINYRLCEERYQKHLGTYNILTGKEAPVIENKEKKPLSNKEKFNKKLNDVKEVYNVKNTGKIFFIIFFYFIIQIDKINRDNEIYATESEKVF